MSVAQQDVLGLHVAVHEPVPVSVVQGIRHLAREPDRLLDRELRFAPQTVAEAPSTYGMVYQSCPCVSPESSNRENVWVVESGRRSGSRAGSARDPGRGELRVQDLERHAPVVLEIVR